MFNFSNYSNKSKYYIDEIKDETTAVAIEEFVGIKPKMHLFFPDENGEHKNQRSWIEMLLQQ